MRILWVSNGPAVKTGYGVQTALFAPRIQSAGYHIDIMDYLTVHASYTDSNGILCLPSDGSDAVGNGIVARHAQFRGADVVIGLFDPHQIAPSVYRQFNWCQWTPSDCEPPLPANLQRLRDGGARWVWSMSKHGDAQLRSESVRTRYIPLAVDTNAYKPINRVDAETQAAKLLGMDADELASKFLVVAVAANKGHASGRKGLREMLHAFKLFSDNHPDALLYIHTKDAPANGNDLYAWLAQFELDPAKVKFADQYLYESGLYKDSWLNAIYNRADVYLSMSYGEGFGVPIVEAQAAGCPVIVPDSSSMPELVFSGWTINKGTDYSYYEGTNWRIPDVNEAAGHLERAYRIARQLGMRRAARLGALNYDVDRVFRDYMLPALQDMAWDVYDLQHAGDIVTLPAREAS